jgi:threonine/homoserine/homoserine lactone efflux protein
MSWHSWALFAFTETVLCLVPGPAVLLVLSQALAHGTGKAVWSIMGIVAANTIYFVLSATGLAAILVASYDLFFAIKWIGALYLIWLGLSTMFGASGPVPLSITERRSVPGRRMFLNGVVLQLSNPKALVFFTAFLPQFVDPHRPLWLQILILAFTSFVIEFLVQLFYATLADRASSWAKRPSFGRVLNRFAGGLLIAAGVSMAAVRRA